MSVKFAYLERLHEPISSELNAAVQNVLASGVYVLGPQLEKFENQFAQMFEVSYCLAVHSGTAALHLALWALGIKEGDEVIVPSHTFFATAEAVALTGARPVFVDCESNYHTIDLNKIEAAITPKTKAVIAVHLYGQAANLNQLKQICSNHSLALVEDCAQSVGTLFEGRPAGSFSDVACFSFYPTKNLGATGEGGAVITKRKDLLVKMQLLRNHGQEKRYLHTVVGHNYRLDEMQCAILNVKLKYLAATLEKRQAIAKKYTQALGSIKKLKTPEVRPQTQHSYHLYVVETEKRDSLQSFLADNKIATMIHYPTPCHQQPAFAGLPKVSLPVTERLCSQILSLPICPGMLDAEVDATIDTVQRFFSS